MFCTGAPGGGKTIITSIAIDSLLQSARNAEYVGIAYIYCNFRRQDEQRVESLLSSLLGQLAEMRSSLPTEVRKLYSKHSKKGTLPSIEEISATLAAVAIDYSRIFIFIDALDEGPNSEGGIKKRFSSCRPNTELTFSQRRVRAPKLRNILARRSRFQFMRPSTT